MDVPSPAAKRREQGWGHASIVTTLGPAAYGGARDKCANGAISSLENRKNALGKASTAASTSQRAMLEGLVAGCCMIPNSTTAGISRVMWELAGQGQPLWLHFQTKHSAKAHSPLSHSGGHTCGWASLAPSPPQHTTGFHPGSRRSPQAPTACLVWSCCVCFLFPLTFKYKYASWGKRS